MRYYILLIPAALTLTACSHANKEDLAYVNEQEARIKQHLKDPESAQFRNIHVYQGANQGANQSATPAVVCGEVSANNGAGGRNGYQRFVSSGTTQVLESEMAHADMNKAWDQLCQ